VAVNCAAIPDNLLESEMFGHEKGAFQWRDGAAIGNSRRRRRTLLLDEVSEMDVRLQASCCACCRNAKSTGSAAARRCG